MTPTSARALRRARVAALRQAEPELSLRSMADRLGISRDTVRRDLEALQAAPVAQSATAARGGAAPDRPVAHAAPQVTAGGAPALAHSATAAPGPAGVAGPLAGIDVSQWRSLRQDLAVLAQTGRSPEALVHQAVATLAHAYRRALAAGQVEPGRSFFVAEMTLRQPPARPDTDGPP